MTSGCRLACNCRLFRLRYANRGSRSGSPSQDDQSDRAPFNGEPGSIRRSSSERPPSEVSPSDITTMPGGARPPIVLGPLHNAGPYGIALDVTDRIPKISKLNYRRMAPPVPQLFAAPVPGEKRLCVALQRKLHREGDRLGIFGNGDHMDVISHQRIRPDLETGLPGLGAHNLEEPQPVLVIEKHILT